MGVAVGVASPRIERVTLAITCSSPAGGFPFQYILQYKRRLVGWDDVNDTVSVTIGSDMLSFTIEGLDSRATYDVRIRSENLNGLSNFSTETTITTFGEWKL